MLVAAFAFIVYLARTLGSSFILLLGFAGVLTALILPSFLPARDEERRNAWRCGATAIMADMFAASLCIYLPGTYSMLLLVPAAFLAGVSVLVAWGIWSYHAHMAARRVAVNFLAGPAILALAASLLIMSFTWWPLRVAFVISRPALERLANRTATGGPVTRPQWAGFFWVERTAVDPSSGNVGLITIDPKSGPSGLVRIGRGSKRTLGPIWNHNIDMLLDGRWRYQEED
jgi:hypothetical protein